MAKLKLTKNELKKQKDQLKMFQRYLPTLMLKKQQLQAEIRGVENRINELRDEKERLDESFKSWIAVFSEKGVFTLDILRITKIAVREGNIAGVPIPIFDGTEFEITPYDLLRKPLWLDSAVENLKKALEIDMEARVLAEQQRRLEKELRTTTQRVNLFEKIKIPEAKGNIKKIQVYLGDQQTAAVVRGKISKRGMEKAAG
ncbi:MAG: V-type ATP synthase subunit D [Spirochaetaceae bacterium]|jgi:V/A-type H+-transporting ATPase subunit D|nr:V-type ATP synthase subunit D [Spirochaetaceae bacterium]